MPEERQTHGRLLYNSGYHGSNQIKCTKIKEQHAPGSTFEKPLPVTPAKSDLPRVIYIGNVFRR
jgi:hypothetical protein